MQQPEIRDVGVQYHTPQAGPKRWKAVALFTLLALIASSILVFSHQRQASIPAPMPSSLGLIFAREHVSAQTQIYNISGRDASLHWKQAFDLFSPLSVVQGEITYVIGDDQKDHAHHIFALRTNDGSILWQTHWTTMASTQGPIDAQPVIADGNIYLSERGVSGQGRVLALRTSDGKQLWTLSLNNYSNSALDQPLAAGSSLLFVGSTEGIIRAYHSSNGTLAWSSQLSSGGYNTVFPVFSNGMLFVLSPLTREVVALHAYDKKIQWRLPNGSRTITSLIVRGTHLYLSGNVTSSKNYVYVFDTHSGHFIWQQSIANNLEFNVEEAAGIAYVTSGDGLYALHADTGLLIWQKQGQDAATYGQPVVTDGVVFVKIFYLSSSTSIFCLFGCTVHPPTINAFRASDGSPYWEYTTDFAEHTTNVPPGIATDSNHSFLSHKTLVSSSL